MDDNEIERRELNVRFSRTTCTSECKPEDKDHSPECFRNAYAAGTNNGPVLVKLCGIDRLADNTIYTIEESEDYLDLERKMNQLVAKQKQDGRDPAFENYFLEPTS